MRPSWNATSPATARATFCDSRSTLRPASLVDAGPFPHHSAFRILAELVHQTEPECRRVNLLVEFHFTRLLTLP
jgi:hypothetical protein